MRIALSLSLSYLLVGCSLSGTTAKGLQRSTITFTRGWTASVSPIVDSAPIAVEKVRVTGKSRTLLYVLAGNNAANCRSSDPVKKATLYAVDAANGRILWKRSTSGPSRCTTAGPAADPAAHWVYADGLDGRVHRYAVTTGKEQTSGGWPITVTRMPDVEKVSSAFTVSQGYLYVTTSGYIGDGGHYEGHLVTINVKTGRSAVFNSLCSSVHRLLGPAPGGAAYCASIQSGLFGRGQGVTDPINHDVYIVTGNGPWNGKTDWGDSILKLNPAGTKLVDTFTPTNQSTLNSQDLDLGSTGPAMLPPISSGGKTYHLLVQGGKGPACDGCSGAGLRLLNRDNLSGQGGPGHLGGDLADAIAPGGCVTLTAPAISTSSTHVTTVIYANDCGTAGYRVTISSAGDFTLQRVWQNGTSGSTPVVHGGVLYVAHNNAIVAYNPASGKVLGQTSEIGRVHWQYPLVQGPHLYMTDKDGRLTAFTIRRG
jgi:outer membrane protein assembly factor BamB